MKKTLRTNRLSHQFIERLASKTEKHQTESRVQAEFFAGPVCCVPDNHGSIPRRNLNIAINEVTGTGMTSSMRQSGHRRRPRVWDRTNQGHGPAPQCHNDHFDAVLCAPK